jgi:predicted nucleic acid-binding protein
MAKPSAVLDTDVLLGPLRNILIELAERKVYTLFLSRFHAWELGRVAQRMGFGEVKHKRLFGRLDAIANLVDHRHYMGHYPDWLQDADDYPLLAAALVAQADYLVTANTQDFPPGKGFGKLTIITPQEFLDILIHRTMEGI